ncbi:hypothetical protein P5704_024120 (plasmid) [Pseudomonas sp. FeN3W]|nr:hypothetical protein P5704_024120 [Pseudomonas sp. FeN3W]
MLNTIQQTMLEIIRTGDKALISAYFTHLFPLLPADNKFNFYEYDYQDILISDDTEIKEQAELIVSIVGFNEKSSKTYISRFLGCRDSDRKERYKFVESALHELGKHTKTIFTTACLVGDADTAEKIKSIHGDLTISVTSVSGAIMVDGETYYGFSERMVNSDAESIRRSIELLENAGAGAILFLDFKGNENPSDSRFFNDQRSRFIYYQPDKLEPQSIPVFNGGRIRNADLLHALSEKQHSNRLEKAYKRAPCWVNESDIGCLATARYYRPVQYFSTVGGAKIDYKDLNPSHLEKPNTPDIKRCVMSIVEDLQYKCDEPLSADNMRLHAMMDDLTLSGFGHDKGYVLCVADVDELLLYSSGQMNQSTLDKLRSYAENLACHEYLSAIYSDNYVELGIDENNIIRFLDLISSTPKLLAEFRDKIGEEPLMNICSRNRNSSTFLNAIHKQFGYNNKHFEIRIQNAKFLDDLYQNGFRFEDGSSRLPRVIDPQHSVHIDFQIGLFSATKLCEMGLWPGEAHTRPESIESALKSAVKLSANTNAYYRGYLKAAGVEEVSKACKTAPQWTLLLNLFEEHEIERVRAMIPKKLMQLQISSDFGL